VSRRKGQRMAEIEFELLDLGAGWADECYGTFAAAATTDWANQPVYVSDLRPENEPSLQAYPRLTELVAAQALFGFGIDTSLGWTACPPGQACWKLIGLQLRTGIAAVIPLVIGPSGVPNANILVYENWPSVETPEVAPTPLYYRNYVAGWTNADGVVGFGYGAGGVVGSGGGPFAIWASNAPPGLQPQYADCLKRVGWLGGTDHFTPSPVFAYVVKPAETTPEPTPGGSGCATFLGALGKLLQKMAEGQT